jgi:serine acetyltransferase
MDYEEFKRIIKSDYNRYNPDNDWILMPFFTKPECRYIFWLRITRYLADRKGFFSFITFLMSRFFLVFYFLRYGLNISIQASIGPGFCIEHLGRIAISPDAKIGENCNIDYNVIIGRAYQGKHPGVPEIKDNVHIGHDAKIVGGIEVGSNVAVRSKSVVTESVSDDLVVMTLPDFLGFQ